MGYQPFVAGEVVWAPDPYHDGDPLLTGQGERPWLVLSRETFPGHGEHYIVCALTSNQARHGSFLPIDPNRDWVEGGTRRESQIDTETIMTMKHKWIPEGRAYVGRVTHEKLRAARTRIKSYL